MKWAYYNEHDPFAAEWLRRLILFGHIAPGELDERSIEDVTPDDLSDFTQCHFFAGIGVWSYSLRLAGWPDDRPVWTGSCPCQPFSAAGKRGGTADERHLWPAFFHLIDFHRPPIVFGEQVASKDGLNWLDLVSADMEGAGYAFGAADLCAAGVGAPHIRQRLWFVGVADDDDARLEGWRQSGRERAAERAAWPGGVAERVADDDEQGESGRGIQRPREGDSVGPGSARERSEGLRTDGRVADAERRAAERHGFQVGSATRGMQGAARQQRLRVDAGDGIDVIKRPGPTNGFWRDADWLCCRDGKWRPVESGTFPLAHGAPARVGRLRAYGNAIVAEAAATFIEAVTDVLPC